MNLLPLLQTVLAEVTGRFPGHIEETRIPRDNELYLHIRGDGVAALCAFLYRKWQGRLVSLFAEDARAEHGSYVLFHVFALDAPTPSRP